jgi:hypothetical protein
MSIERNTPIRSAALFSCGVPYAKSRKIVQDRRGVSCDFLRAGACASSEPKEDLKGPSAMFAKTAFAKAAATAARETFAGRGTCFSGGRQQRQWPMQGNRRRGVMPMHPVHPPAGSDRAA